MPIFAFSTNEHFWGAKIISLKDGTKKVALTQPPSQAPDVMCKQTITVTGKQIIITPTQK